MFIYKITNLINNKIYIGQTVQKPNSRWQKHLSDAKIGSTCPIHLAIKKYGKNNFKFEVIDGALSQSELDYKEIHNIYKFNSLSPKGYNLKLGNMLDNKTKIRISNTLKKVVDLDKMKKLTELSKEKSCKKIKIININTGDITIFPSLKSLETIGISHKYVGEILNGKRYYKAYKGFLFEYLDKITIKKLKKPNKQKVLRKSKFRAVERICRITGETKKYKKITDVMLDGHSKHTIKQYLRKTKNNCSPYIWKYAETTAQEAFLRQLG